MDQRLNDLAELVGRLLAERWYRLQQHKRRSPSPDAPTKSKRASATNPSSQADS